MSKSNLLMQNLSSKQKVQEFIKQKDGVLEQRNSVFNGKENADEVVARVKGKTPEEIKELSNEEVDALLMVKGETLEVPEEQKETMDEYAFKKDLLIYVLESEKAFEEIEKGEEELNNALKENEDEIEAILNEFDGSIIKAIRADIQSRQSTVSSPEQQKVLDTILESFDDSFTLNRIFDIYSTINVANTLEDYKKNFIPVYKQYSSVNKALGNKMDLVKFGGLEVKFLEEKYHAYPNLLIFVVMKFMSKRNINSNVKKHNDGVFISQFCSNLYMLFTDSLDTENKELLLASVRKVLDLFYV